MTIENLYIYLQNECATMTQATLYHLISLYL